jgi:uncharacterized protein YecE (DUF72 family)
MPRRKLKSALHIGTAGWSIPSRYKETFAGDGSHLTRYARRLNAVEINSSFHRHHRVQTYARWAASVPATFRFAVKVPRALTHDGALAPLPEVLDRFIEEVHGLESKLAVLLVQLPPKLAFDEAAAKRFFRAVQKRIDVSLVCEPRHATWSSPRADRVLRDFAVARVAADPPPWPGANEPGGHDQLAYFRWHGQPRTYYSDYEAECLASLRKQVASARASQIWTIFDNTAHGHALGNAISIADQV